MSDKLSGFARIKRWLFDLECQESSGCTLCGSCFGRGPSNPMEDEPGGKWKCPSYSLYAFQKWTPKARWLWGTRVFHGLEEFTEEFKEVLFHCTSCGACKEICGINPEGPVDVFNALKEEIVKRDGPYRGQLRVMQNLEATGHIQGAAALQRARWLESLPLLDASKDKVETLFFAGCPVVNNDSVQRSAARLLLQADIAVGALGSLEQCCGSGARLSGNVELSRRLKDANTRQWEQLGIKEIVTTCACCYSELAGEYELKEKGIQVYHIAQYLEKLVVSGQLKLLNPLEKTVTYHDPCQLGRLAGVYEAPRNLLKAIPGLKFVEMPYNRRWSRCCGGGGGASTGWAFPSFAEAVARDRVMEALASGAEILSSACPFCGRFFRSGLQDQTLVYRDVVELVAEAAGLEEVVVL